MGDKDVVEMESYSGEGRTRIRLTSTQMGSGLIVCLSNENEHIGAVALGEFDAGTRRASTSVITRLGHKDDVVAAHAAHRLAKELRRPVCVIAGIHLEGITEAEIGQVLANCDSLIDALIATH